MRILVLHSQYRSGYASGENSVVAEEAELLRSGGHNVVVWNPMVDDDTAWERAKAGGRLVWSAHASREIRRLIEQHQPDVVHVHNLFPNLSPGVILAASKADVAVVMTLHNYRLMCLPGTLLRDGFICEDCVGRTPWPGVIHRCYQDSYAASALIGTSLAVHRALNTFAQVDAYLAISEFVAAKYVEFGIPSERVIVKRNFAPPGPSRQGPGEVFLYAGRFSHEKGLDSLLRIWSDIPAELVACGGDASMLPSDVPIPGNMTLLGTVKPGEIKELLTRTRAVLVPSRWYEGAGKVVLEAYAAGVPVIASQIGALPEVVHHGSTGLLVPPDDLPAWGDGIRTLLDDEVAIALGASAHEVWQATYTPQHALQALEQAYATAINTRADRVGRRPS